MPANLDFFVAAQEIESSKVDRDLFLSALAKSLSSTLAKQVKVQHSGFIKRTVRAITIFGPDDQLTIEIDRFSHLRCFKRPIVNGIALEGKALDLSQWLSELTTSTKAQADARHSINQALQQSVL